jgi:hypothetical protein
VRRTGGPTVADVPGALRRGQPGPRVGGAAGGIVQRGGRCRTGAPIARARVAAVADVRCRGSRHRNRGRRGDGGRRNGGAAAGSQ